MVFWSQNHPCHLLTMGLSRRGVSWPCPGLVRVSDTPTLQLIEVFVQHIGFRNPREIETSGKFELNNWTCKVSLQYKHVIPLYLLHQFLSLIKFFLKFNSQTSPSCQKPKNPQFLLTVITQILPKNLMFIATTQMSLQYYLY